MASINRQWLLASRPRGKITLDDFVYRKAPFDPPHLEEGQILVQNLMFACTPTLRNWMNAPDRSYRASLALDRAITGMATARVLASRNPRYAVGSRLTAVSSWQDYAVLAPESATMPVLAVPDDMALRDAMGIYGVNSLTAYFGILRVGQPQPGETVVVSGAAGSTGSIAAQIARLHGCRVIGIAGGAAKCDWLRDACRLSDAIDYKSEDVTARLRALCPEGVDVFYDNVGGDILQAVMDNIARRGRIAVCGQISAYDGDSPAPGPRDMMKVVYWQVRIQGFLLGDYMAEAEAARADLIRWNEAGEIVHREDVRRGFKELPTAFLDLFRGANDGTLLVEVEDRA